MKQRRNTLATASLFALIVSQIGGSAGGASNDVGSEEDAQFRALKATIAGEGITLSDDYLRRLVGMTVGELKQYLTGIGMSVPSVLEVADDTADPAKVLSADDIRMIVAPLAPSWEDIPKEMSSPEKPTEHVYFGIEHAKEQIAFQHARMAELTDSAFLQKEPTIATVSVSLADGIEPSGTGIEVVAFANPVQVEDYATMSQMPIAIGSIGRLEEYLRLAVDPSFDYKQYLNLEGGLLVTFRASDGYAYGEWTTNVYPAFDANGRVVAWTSSWDEVDAYNATSIEETRANLVSRMEPKSVQVPLTWNSDHAAPVARGSFGAARPTHPGHYHVVPPCGSEQYWLYTRFTVGAEVVDSLSSTATLGFTNGNSMNSSIGLSFTGGSGSFSISGSNSVGGSLEWTLPQNLNTGRVWRPQYQYAEHKVYCDNPEQWQWYVLKDLFVGPGDNVAAGTFYCGANAAWKHEWNIPNEQVARSTSWMDEVSAGINIKGFSGQYATSMSSSRKITYTAVNTSGYICGWDNYLAYASRIYAGDTGK